MHRLLLGLLLAASAAAQPVAVAIDVGDREGVAVGLRGDTAPLAWDRSLPLADPDGDGVFEGVVPFPEGTGRVAYKAVFEGDEPEWEPGENRLLIPGGMDADRRAFGGPQSDLPLLTLSAEEVTEDLRVLREGLTALHPGLTLHNTSAEVDALFDRLDQTMHEAGDAVTFDALYLAVAGAVAGIRDGHTQVSMYNQGAYVTAALYGRADRVPFAFRLVGGRMIVTGDATPDGALPPGTEVLTLDGRPVADVLAALRPFASADGANDAKRIDQLEVSGVLAPAERFDVIYGLLFQPTGDLALTVRDADGTERTLAVSRMTQAARRATLHDRDADLPRSLDDLLRWTLLPDATALLRIGSFSTFNMDLDYATWLVGAFEAMAEAGAERLVVDLRGNAGGMDDAAALLLMHLLDAPASVTRWQGVTAYDVVPEALREHIGSWSDDFYDLSNRVTPVGDGTFRFRERGPQTVHSAPDAFAGPRAVLIDAAASSATFYLAQAIRETGAATLVGQTTGGSLKGLNGGQTVFLTLPNSGIVVDVPLFGARPAEPGPDRGLVPDVVVPPDAEAVVAGRDPELEAAVAALRAEAPSDG